MPDPNAYPTRERDLIPDDRIYSALPVSGLEGERAVVESGSDFLLYLFLKGAWRLIGPVTYTFDDLAPTTDKGDLIVHNGSTNVRFGAGTDGQVLFADSLEPEGVKWDDLPLTPALKKDVSLIGSASAQDLLFQLPASSNTTIFRIESNDFTAVQFGGGSLTETAFRFKAPFNFTLTALDVWLAKVGSPVDNVKIDIYSHNVISNQPNASLASTTISSGALTGSTAMYTATFNLQLTGGTYYWIVFDRSGADSGTDLYSTYENHPTNWPDPTGIFPDTAQKVSGDSTSTWSSRRDAGRYEMRGTIGAGFHKWHGARTNVDCGGFAGVVESVNGSTARIVVAGYMSGLSGLTRGQVYSINNVKVGIAISTTELIVFNRKSMMLKNIGCTLANTEYVYLPTGFTHLTRTGSGFTFSTSGAIGAEFKMTSTTGSGSTVSVSNEYESI